MTDPTMTKTVALLPELAAALKEAIRFNAPANPGYRRVGFILPDAIAWPKDGSAYDIPDAIYNALTREATQTDQQLREEVERLRANGEFLCARVRELEGSLTDDGEAAREFFGHVIPALARMEAALSSSSLTK